MTDKTAKYELVLQEQLKTLYEHMQSAIDSVPGEMLDTDIEEHRPIVEMVRAIEQEWIVDPEMRRELSLLEDIH